MQTYLSKIQYELSDICGEPVSIAVPHGQVYLHCQGQNLMQYRNYKGWGGDAYKRGDMVRRGREERKHPCN